MNTNLSEHAAQHLGAMHCSMALYLIGHDPSARVFGFVRPLTPSPVFTPLQGGGGARNQKPEAGRQGWV
jgi:hypothetical protein